MTTERTEQGHVSVTRASTSITCEVPVFYASTEGHTHRIADRFAARLRVWGVDSAAFDVAEIGGRSIDWTRVRYALVGASLHAGKHQRAMRDFVARYAGDLSARPSIFFSVSLSAASTHPEEVDAARRLADAFPTAHGWTATRIESIAGCLAYTRYGFIKRWIMQRIARKEGAPTDATRDFDLTDWSQVDALARQVADTVTTARASAA